MNKAITDGVVFAPLPFSSGLGIWSSGDGTPGSDTYAVSGNGVYVSADQDFAGCLEVLKSATVAKVRYMGETPILKGCYLQVRAKVKAVAGPMPSVRIAGWAGLPGGSHATGVVEVGASTQLTTYGEAVEITAIIATADRTGVDMVWNGISYGHFGIDLTGPSGGLVRVDDIVIEDVTNVFVRDMMSMVDVRDYGAKGNGATDDSAAFEAADAAANGRVVLVSGGVFKLAQDVTMESKVQFEGTITQSADKRFILQKGFNFESYLNAFGDETTAFKKAFQALLNFADHESLDLCGRRISLSGPVDMQAADPSRTSYATRRVIRNGQFQAETSANWDTTTVTSLGTYATSNPTRLTNVVNVANVPVGALVTGAGVGREIYVSGRNIGAKIVYLSAPLYDAAGTQNFTFKRFKYLLDFSGFESLSQFVLDDIEFQGNGFASGVMLASSGITFQVRDCFFTKPKDRGLTSIGTGCQGMMVDRCQFNSNETALNVQSRTSIAMNTNANDVKIRDNRVMMFRHFAVIAGGQSLITGNHWFQGDTQQNGVRTGGIVITSPNPATSINGNYIDNNFLEWTNEHSAEPALGAQFSFGGMTIANNIFFASNVASSFKFIVIKRLWRWAFHSRTFGYWERISRDQRLY
ncbi:glycosyl hydrolase family 28-related protein [Yoonia sp. MH D7]